MPNHQTPWLSATAFLLGQGHDMPDHAEPSPSWSILLEDGPVLAIHKPAGLLTQAPHGVPSLEAEVKAYLKQRFQKPGGVYLGIPHRLDRAVSGVIVFARNSKAAARLAEQFERRQITKVYWALVERVPNPRDGELTDWLLKRPEQSRAEIVDPSTPGARECRLSYRTLSENPTGTLLEVWPYTGRMHQIRVQLAARGYPILGDEPYGSTIPFGDLVLLPRDRPIALHARSLSFQHPVRYEPLTVTAPLPALWGDNFRRMSESGEEGGV